jgi:hypothetical protein
VRQPKNLQAFAHIVEFGSPGIQVGREGFSEPGVGDLAKKTDKD